MICITMISSIMYNFLFNDNNFPMCFVRAMFCHVGMPS